MRLGEVVAPRFQLLLEDLLLTGHPGGAGDLLSLLLDLSHAPTLFEEGLVKELLLVVAVRPGRHRLGVHVGRERVVLVGLKVVAGDDPILQGLQRGVERLLLRGEGRRGGVRDRGFPAAFDFGPTLVVSDDTGGLPLGERLLGLPRSHFFGGQPGEKVGFGQVRVAREHGVGELVPLLCPDSPRRVELSLRHPALHQGGEGVVERPPVGGCPREGVQVGGLQPAAESRLNPGNPSRVDLLIHEEGFQRGRVLRANPEGLFQHGEGLPLAGQERVEVAALGLQILVVLGHPVPDRRVGEGRHVAVEEAFGARHQTIPATEA